MKVTGTVPRGIFWGYGYIFCLRTENAATVKTPLGNGYSNKHGCRHDAFHLLCDAFPRLQRLKPVKVSAFSHTELFMWTDWDTFIVSRCDSRLGCHRSWVQMPNDLFTPSLFRFMDEGRNIKTQDGNWSSDKNCLIRLNFKQKKKAQQNHHAKWSTAALKSKNK